MIIIKIFYLIRYSSSSTSTTTTSNTTTSENDFWGVRRRERAQAEQEKSAPSIRSRSVQPESSSSGYESTPEMTSYERYLQKKTAEENIKPSSSTSSNSNSAHRVTFAEPETPAASTKPSSSYGGSYKSNPSPTPTSTSSSSYGSFHSHSNTSTPSNTSTSNTSTPSNKYSSSTTSAASSSSNSSNYGSISSSHSTTSNTSTVSSGNAYSSTPATKVEAKKQEEVPKKPTPSWKKAAPVVEEEKPKEKPKADPIQPSWKKSMEEKKTASKSSTLEKISESSTPSAPAKTPSWKKKAEEVKQPEPTTTAPANANKPTPSWKKSSTPSSSTNVDQNSSSNNNSYSSSSNSTTGNSTTKTETVVKTVETIKTVVDDTKVKKLENELEDMKTLVSSLKREKSNLQREVDSATTKKPLSFESAKQAEASVELRKAKDKLSEYEHSVSRLEKEKNVMNLKIRELETSIMDRKPSIGNSSRDGEMAAKLKFLEKKCNQLENENDKLKNNVENLEGELEEVQDNFREDEADEYRSLKRDLETQSKNVRVLQFKLKKAERSICDLTAEKAELEGNKSKGGASGIGNDSSKIKTLEKELEQKSIQVIKLEQQITELSRGRSQGKSGGPVLSRTGSVERGVEDQLLKDLQDSIERENDLKEQLNMAEDEANEMRKKLSRIEDENESLAQQVKKMATKGGSSRRSPSAERMRGLIEKDEGISADGEELSLSEIKVQLEVSEGETGLLRKKVDNLLTENLKLTKEIKDINTRLADEKKKKNSSSTSYGNIGGKNADKDYEKKIDDIQTELNSTRVKLIEKEREVERLDAQVKSAAKASPKSKLSRSGSQEEDLSKKIQVIEQEANVLRGKVSKLETENEKMVAENKQLKAQGVKKPASTQEKLQMDKFALEEKVKKLEVTIKDQTKKMNDLQDNISIKEREAIKELIQKQANGSIQIKIHGCLKIK